MGNHFKIYTNQKSLNTFLTQTIQTPEQQKWTTKMQGYDFQILYKPGKNNIVADALSCQDMVDTPVIMVLSAPTPLIFKELK